MSVLKLVTPAGMDPDMEKLLLRLMDLLTKSVENDSDPRKVIIALMFALAAFLAVGPDDAETIANFVNEQVALLVKQNRQDQNDAEQTGMLH